MSHDLLNSLPGELLLEINWTAVAKVFAIAAPVHPPNPEITTLSQSQVIGRLLILAQWILVVCELAHSAERMFSA